MSDDVDSLIESGANVVGGFNLPKTAVRFTVPQYCEWDPVELAVDIRDDYHGQTVPGGCIIYGRFDNSERWHANESARALVRLLMDEVDRLRGEVERLDCRVKELSTAPACGECGAEMVIGDSYCIECDYTESDGATND